MRIDLLVALRASAGRVLSSCTTMEFLLDPTIWVGLITLIVLEIVLGIDNLVFIAIIAKKLPASQQDKALYMGLGLALVMRLGLLSIMSWLVALTDPVFSIWEHPFSLRDLILLGGGLFLLYKATTELHERLEALPHTESASQGKAGFWFVIAQILVLDAVFSLDSIITAVGMVDNLYVMMTAVAVAMIVMIVASRPLTTFVNSHPTVVVLCLSFLLMIGCSLIAEGLGFHLPKGYLYAAIAFSILIEFFNQLAARNASKNLARVPFRERTTSTIVRLMSRTPPVKDETVTENASEGVESFAQEERHMVEGVLTLAERSIKTIMTPRSEIAWLNVRRSFEENMSRVKDMPHSSFPVCDGTLENVIGVIKAKDFIGMAPDSKALAERASKRQPLTVPETINVIRLMQDIKSSQSSLVLVADEFGVIQGLATAHDILEAIAGDFPDEGDRLSIEKVDGGWSAEGSVELFLVEQTCGVDDLKCDDGDYVTLAGLLLDRWGRLPQKGERLEESGLIFEVTEVTRNRIERVKITKAPIVEEGEA